MSSDAVSPIPEHLHTLTPRLVVRDVPAAIDFYRAAFAAQEISERFTGPNGEVIHTELRIGDSVLMITEDSEDRELSPTPPTPQCILATYWENVDAAWQRALAAGAEVIHPLDDHFYGERGGRLRDPLGHQWMLSQRTEHLSHEEMNQRAASYFAPS